MNTIVVPNIFIGTDLVEVSRIRSIIDKVGERFKDRIYTKSEQLYCNKKAKPEIHYAGRFAAKEAIIKAIKSSGYSKPIAFNLINIESNDSTGPAVTLKFECSGCCKVTIAHTDTHASASALFFPQ